MSIKKISGESVVPARVPDGIWSGSNLAEVFPTSGDTNMSCGVHELFASVTVVEKAPVDDVLYILEGEIEIDADGVAETYRAGDFAYLHAGARQTFTVRDRVKHIYVTYPRDWASQ
ncbi:MAG: cupin domain-containing protein [Phycisphaerae bacterium]|nr:cupin domain-containing protein [Phycisphaerae bacterium]